jgi:hypothetical protein
MSSLFTLVLALFNTVFRGFLIKTYWAWFVLTQFPTLPKLSILTAIGLSYMISIIYSGRSFTAWDLEHHQEEYKGYSITLLNQAGMVAALLVSWLGAWIVHSLM